MAKNAKTRLAAPPTHAAAPTNLTSQTVKDLNFKVSEEFYYEFKEEALKSRVKQKDLLVMCLAAFKEKYEGAE